MTTTEPNYYDYVQGGLLNQRYVRVRGLNEGSFGIVSIARDTKHNDQLVAVKYNTGRLSDFEAYQNEQKTKSYMVDVRSVSLNSKTKSVINSARSYSNTENTDKNVSKSIVLRETQQEIAMLKKVDSHLNITTLIDYFDTFMILEYAPRGDLHDAIQLGIAPVATRDVIDVFMQLISAVEFCHQNGVYHRDIKPENILIADDWSIRLTDFGLATENLICTDFDVGSERYMAPELLEHYDIDSYAADKVDIWALGICLLNIVFGKSPFRSASSKDKMFLYFAANREALFDIFPSMSYDLFTVMMHSLTIDPANRDLEMIKRTLLSIDILTYDYEFEEDLNDDNKAGNISESSVDTAPLETLAVEAKNAIEDIEVPKLETSTKDEVLVSKPSEPVSTTETNGSDRTAQDKTHESATSHLLINSNSKNMNLIDTVMESEEKDDTFALASPILIQKKYEPPHKHLSHTTLSRYFAELKSLKKQIFSNQNQNTHNNRNFRAKRWNNVHRKPLKIANSNGKLQDEKLVNAYKGEDFDFNRKDFFTPKSVFTNYMEKANKGRQQMQQKDYHNRKYNNYEKSSEYMSNYKYSNNYNHYNSNNIDRRAWQKRKRRPSYLSRTNNHNKNNNKGSFKTNNKVAVRDSVRSRNNDRNSQKPRRLSAMENIVLSRSSRASIDGKYVPPNVRLEAAHLIGSAIDSDDDDDYDYSARSRRSFNSYGSSKVRGESRLHNVVIEDEETDVEDEFEDEGFTFEFDDPEPSFRSRDISNLISNFDDDKRFHQIQANAINSMAKQLSETKLFDEKVTNSRDTSHSTTVSYNFSSIGSNINNSPKESKKYIPPHQRRSSHSGGDSIAKQYNKDAHNHLVDRINYRYLSPVSSSAPTKGTSFFNVSTKMINPHELLLTHPSLNDNDMDDHSDDLFDIEENN